MHLQKCYYEKNLYLIKLENNATNAPNITGLAPAQLQDNLRGPVVPGRHHRRVVLPVEGGGPEVDELDARVFHAAHGALRVGADLGVPVMAYEQDVLGLQVRVGQVVVMQELNKILIFSFYREIN